MRTGIKKISIILVLIMAFMVNISMLYGYFIFFYQNASHTVEKMTVDAMISQTSFIMNDLNNDVLELLKRQHEAMQMRSFNILAVPEVSSYSSYDVSNAKNDVANTTRILMSNKAIIKDVSVYFKDRSIKISALNSISSISEEDRLFIDRLLQKKTHRLLYQDGRIFVFSSLNENIGELVEKKEIPYVFMVSEISTSKIIANISNSFQAGGSYPVALVRSDTAEILSSSLDSGEAARLTELLARWDTGDGGGYRIESINKTRYVISYSGSKELGWTLFKFVPERDIFVQLFVLRNLTLISVAVFLATLVLFVLSMYILIYKPIRSLIRGFSHVAQGKLAYSLAPTISREFDSLFCSFNKMTGRLYDLIEKEYKQKLLIRESELKQLQLQINPHFLFNTFFILNSMIKNGEYEEAENMSGLLGAYFEYIFHNEGDTVLLQQEIEFAGVYCEIQSIRFPRIAVHGIGNLPDGTGNIKVPKLILQPIFENAFKYAFRSRKDDNRIDVDYGISGDTVQINIEDNGGSMSEEKLRHIRDYLERTDDSKESALANINCRLKLFYGEEYGLAADRSESGGLRISVRLRRELRSVSDAHCG